MGKICILSGLEIPKGKESREHYCCKHRFPKKIWNNKNNIFWAHTTLNGVKGDCLPCEFEELKYKLTYHALMNWNLQPEDRDFLRRAIENWEIYVINPCDLCIANCYSKGR